jgi:hypothetical protein
MICPRMVDEADELGFRGIVLHESCGAYWRREDQRAKKY